VTGVRLRSVVVVVGLLFASATATACSTHDCEYDGSFDGAGSIVGTITSIHGDSAVFAAESWAPTPGVAAPPSPPRAGATLSVKYQGDETKFLRVGRRYKVTVFVDAGSSVLSSGVHTADNCSHGTTYSDGQAIDTSMWSRSLVRRSVIGFIVLLVVVLAFLVWVTLRIRRRRPATIVVQESAE